MTIQIYSKIINTSLLFAEISLVIRISITDVPNISQYNSFCSNVFFTYCFPIFCLILIYLNLSCTKYMAFYVTHFSLHLAAIKKELFVLGCIRIVVIVEMAPTVSIVLDVVQNFILNLISEIACEGIHLTCATTDTNRRFVGRKRLQREACLWSIIHIKANLSKCSSLLQCCAWTMKTYNCQNTGQIRKEKKGRV